MQCNGIQWIWTRFFFQFPDNLYRSSFNENCTIILCHWIECRHIGAYVTKSPFADLLPSNGNGTNIWILRAKNAATFLIEMRKCDYIIKSIALGHFPVSVEIFSVFLDSAFWYRYGIYWDVTSSIFEYNKRISKIAIIFSSIFSEFLRSSEVYE